ncbi:hypothetical protein GINT2_000522 [Glugoides intestinalis]
MEEKSAMYATSGKISIIEHPMMKDEKYGEEFMKLPLKCYRQCIRDGNCLYSAIAILIFPLFNIEEFKNNFFNFEKEFNRYGITDIVYEPLIDSIRDFIEQKEDASFILYSDFLAFISYLRFVCSAYAVENKEKYNGFVLGDIEDYCRSNVDPMEQRGGELEFAVLADALKIKIEVIYALEKENLVVSFGKGENLIKVLHTPDHYEPVE